MCLISLAIASQFSLDVNKDDNGCGELARIQNLLQTFLASFFSLNVFPHAVSTVFGSLACIANGLQ